MVKQAIRYRNQRRKVILITLLISLASPQAFAQSDSAINRGITSHQFIRSQSNTDSIAQLMRKSGVNFNSIFLYPIEDSKGPGSLRFFSESRKNINSSVQSMIKSPLALNHAVLVNESSIDSSYLTAGERYYTSNTNLVSDWSLAGIPLEFYLQQQTWSDFTSRDQIRFSVSFDREGYLAQLKKKLSGSLNPSVLLPQIKNPLEDILRNARQSLTAELQQVNSRYKGMLDMELNHITGLKDLFSEDAKLLKNRFLNYSAFKSLTEKQKQLAVLQQQINNGEEVDPTLLQSLQNEIGKLHGLQELIQKFEQHKTKWEQTGLLQKIRDFEVLKGKSITSMLNDPSTITRLARQKLSLSGLQRTFLNITRLEIGQNALSLAPLSFQNFINKGISTEFMAGRKTLRITAGKYSDFNSVFDYPFSNSPFATNGIVKAFGINTGSESKFKTDVSVSSFSQMPAEIPGLGNPAASMRQVLVTTILNNLSLGSQGNVSVELSRSATRYNGGDDKGNASRIIAMNDIMANTAIKLRYSDELIDEKLSYQVHFSKIANGYTNPGNSYLSPGSTEFGVALKKMLLKNRLSLSFRGNGRVYRYNDHIDASWINSNILFDARWKMKKGQHIALRYQPVRMSRREEGVKKPVNSIDRLSFDISIYKKFGKLTYRNFLSLTGQRNRYEFSPGSFLNNKSVMISSYQHLMIGRRTIYVNLNYNHADATAQYYFMSTSLYAEAGYNYQIIKTITGSTGMVYNRVKGWYSQAGVRQTFSGQLGEKFSLHLYADLKRNLSVTQPLWNDPVRADISLRYIIKSVNE